MTIFRNISVKNLKVLIREEIQRFAETDSKKLYYHGRNIGNRPYSGNYIFITDSLGYASGYSDGKELYTYSIPFDEDKLFSIRNPEHRNLLSKYLDIPTILAMRRDSGPDQELDWAALSYVSTDDYELPEDLFQHLGFLGIRLKERTGIESIYIFDQDNLKFEGKIDLRNPEIIKQIGGFYKDFQKDKNFLETVINEVQSFTQESKTIFSDVPPEIFQTQRLRKFSDEANRNHMKIFRAKDGKQYIVKKLINEDVFRIYALEDLTKPIATAVFNDDNNDYITGYEHRQSIVVNPEYRRLGLATAITDFAEQFYGKPYKPTNVLSTDMQGFVKSRNFPEKNS